MPVRLVLALVLGAMLVLLPLRSLVLRLHLSL